MAHEADMSDCFQRILIDDTLLTVVEPTVSLGSGIKPAYLAVLQRPSVAFRIHVVVAKRRGWNVFTTNPEL
jgi:hypothetical protein